MKESTRNMLEIAYEECQEKDKSPEYTLQYLQDFANVSFDCALKFYNQQQ
jgi:hypothetical protein